MRKINAMVASQSLVEIDINAEVDQELVRASQKITRNVWKEVHKSAQVKQIYLDECRPIGKRTRKEVNAAWTSLVRTLSDCGNGPFDGLDLSILVVPREMTDIMRR